MSTEPVHNAAPQSLPPSDRTGPGTIAYRVMVLLLLGICAWFLSRSPSTQQGAASNAAYALPGNTWQHEHEFDKKPMTSQIEFRADGTISQHGSGQGKFSILSSSEISIDPTSPTGGLFGWPQGATKDNWSVTALGSDLLLQRKSPPHDRVVLHKVKQLDEQTKEILRALREIRTELMLQGSARRSENAAIQSAVQSLGKK